MPLLAGLRLLCCDIDDRLVCSVSSAGYIPAPRTQWNFSKKAAAVELLGLSISLIMLSCVSSLSNETPQPVVRPGNLYLRLGTNLSTVTRGSISLDCGCDCGDMRGLVIVRVRE